MIKLNNFRLFQPICLILLFLLTSCATTPLSKKLSTDHPLRIGIISFKVTAPIKKISSIEENHPEKLTPEKDKILVSKALRNVETLATKELINELRGQKKVEPIIIPVGTFGIRKGEKPTAEQLTLLKNKFDVDAIFYGEIPWYGKTKLLYPIIGETVDITAESILIEVVTGSWALVGANIVFELATSTPLWFGGAYIFGWSFRPVTVDGTIISSSDGKEKWSESFDRITSEKILETYPKEEQSKKEVQLEVSLRRAVGALAEAMSK